ncbi:MAG: aldehyde ferredoxin oxidoreductase N-terminal domain-containing protein [Patescibacteria group bacterium]
MISQAKKVLHINLPKHTYEIKSYPDLSHFIGGVGLGLKLLSLYREELPLIFAVGPLNGFFPFASKTSVLMEDNGAIEDLYLGGSLSHRIRYAGLDAIVLLGKSRVPTILEIQDDEVKFHSLDTDLGLLGLPGKKSVLNFTQKGFYLDEYFEAPGKFLEKRLLQKNIKAICVTGTKSHKLKNPAKYEALYKRLLSDVTKLTVAASSNPSCSGCPVGCALSKTGEIGGNLLVHSLVGCAFAEKIYSDVGTVFSCLNVLGYTYTHEDIENLPEIIYSVLEELTAHA